MTRSFLAPEILQVSSMDCGVAALSCFLDGYGVNASYGRLREACQTEVDGTSVDALEDLATSVGLDVSQHLLPLGALVPALEGRLPAVAVVKLPSGGVHFVTIWRRVGDWFHVMDPRRGRSWIRVRDLERELHIIEQHFDAEDWRDWLRDSSFFEVLQARCAALLGGHRDAAQARLAGLSTVSDVACTTAALEVVSRMSREGRTTASLRDEIFVRVANAAHHDWASIPTAFKPIEAAGDGGFVMRSAVVLAATSRNSPWQRGRDLAGAFAKSPSPGGGAATPSFVTEEKRTTLLVWRRLYDLLRDGGHVLLPMLLLGTLATTLASAAEILVYRAAYDAPRVFSTFGQRSEAVMVLASLLFITGGLELALFWSGTAVGRYLELRLRLLTLSLLPRVDDNFIRSRPTSDLAYRAHSLVLGRQFPSLVLSAWRSGLDIVVSVVALCIVDRANLPVAVIGIVLLFAIAFLTRTRLEEADAKFQAHDSRLLTFFLDALRGFRPLRLHGYHNAFRAEQEAELDLWRKTGELQKRTHAGLQAAEVAVSVALLAGVFLVHVRHAADARLFVILAFWAFRIPIAVRSLILQLQSYPAQKNAFSRLLEIADYAREEPEDVAVTAAVEPPPTEGVVGGVDVRFEDVTVVANGHPLLEGVSLHFAAGQHVAVVGPSGAGKSTLVSTLLGFHRPSHGIVRVDGEPLTDEAVRRLRTKTAWVDPAIQLWNESLLDNVEYAASGWRRRELLETLEASDLLGVLEAVDGGLATAVGADGRLVSGGEGQRIRLGRALLKADTRLVVLDEPFRGLDRETRRRLSFRARVAWKNATLFFVSHDISHAMDFERVIVIDGGKVIEDGHPLELAEQPTRFRELLEAERYVLGEAWGPRNWRKIHVGAGGFRDGAT